MESLSTAEGEEKMRSGHSISGCSTSLEDLTPSPSSSSVSGTTDTLFSPPTLARCMTDSPSHYFLRGGHRWSSTPLIKGGGFTRSMSIPVSSTPAMLYPKVLSPPKATSTPDALNNPDCEAEYGSNFSSSLQHYTSMDSIGSLSKLARTPEKKPVSSLAQLGTQEFMKRMVNFEKTETDDLSYTGSDSGFGSLLTEGEEDQHHLVVPPKLRRSPRHISNRLDRCSRLSTTDPKVRAGAVKADSYVVTPGVYLDRERVDLVLLLAERDLWYVLERILSYLPTKDLCGFALVSPVWMKALQGRLNQDERRRRYVNEKKLNLENLGEETLRTRSSYRIAMQEVNRNISPSTKRSRSNCAVINSPSKIRNRLFPDGPVLSTQRLLHCPNCSSSSLVKISKVDETVEEVTATCSSKSCSLVFCGKCMSSEHGGKPCRFLNTSKPKTSVVSSKKSKARLRRL